MALLATVLVSFAPEPMVGIVTEAARPATLAAWHYACLVAAATAAIGVVFALRISRRDALFAARGYEADEEAVSATAARRRAEAR